MAPHLSEQVTSCVQENKNINIQLNKNRGGNEIIENDFSNDNVNNNIFIDSSCRNLSPKIKEVPNMLMNIQDSTKSPQPELFLALKALNKMVEQTKFNNNQSNSSDNDECRLRVIEGIQRNPPPSFMFNESQSLIVLLTQRLEEYLEERDLNSAEIARTITRVFYRRASGPK